MAEEQLYIQSSRSTYAPCCFEIVIRIFAYRNGMRYGVKYIRILESSCLQSIKKDETLLR